MEELILYAIQIGCNTDVLPWQLHCPLFRDKLLYMQPLGQRYKMYYQNRILHMVLNHCELQLISRVTGNKDTLQVWVLKVNIL